MRFTMDNEEKIFVALVITVFVGALVWAGFLWMAFRG
jgi:hypothetical protein